MQLYIKKILKKIYKYTIANINKIRIKNKEFTIISNNCWGGVFYERNNLKYLTPTVGLMLYADDYIKFIYNIKEYLNKELQFINIEQSKYKNYLKKINYQAPIGVLGDIEIIFMHYKTEEEAKEKWDSRKGRINWNRIIYKFSDANLCNYKHLQKFQEFEAKNKICFTTMKYEDIESIPIKKYYNRECIIDDIKYYNRYFNMYKYLNSIK